MNKKKNAIMVADTRISLVGTLLLQIQDTNRGLFDEALIYHQGISEENKNILNGIIPCKFIEYYPPIPEKVLQLPDFKRFSVLMFARYDMFKYLDEYETVTWSDTDVLIQGKLDNLIEKAKATGFVANFENKEDFTNKNPDRVYCSFKEKVEQYDMNRYNMCSGLLIISDKLKNTNAYTEWCYKKTIEYADKLYCPDQGILNLFIQEFNIDAISAGEHGAYCVYPYYKRNIEEAKIIHAWGPRKFWNSWYLHQTFTKWKKYYYEWINIGGASDFQEFRPSVSVVIPSFKPNIKYLKKALDSILINQKYSNGAVFDDLEVIIVLEPIETQAVEKMIQEYDDARITLHINDERYGIAKSINTGIKIAKAKYIMRMDDDDISADTRIAKQKEYLDTNTDIDLCTSDFEYFGDMNERRISFEGEMAKAWSLFTCPFDHPTIMFKKEFFEFNSLQYDEKRGFVEDWELWIRAFEKGMHVGCIHEVLFYHRWYSSSAGQNNKTIQMMQDLVYLNFEKLAIVVSDDMKGSIAPWNGKIVDESKYTKLIDIFSDAIKNNCKLRIYDDKALLKVFMLRLEEARTGKIPEIVGMAQGIPDNPIKKWKRAPEHRYLSLVKAKFNNIIFTILAPLYEPINLQMEEVKTEIQKCNNEITSVKKQVELNIQHEINKNNKHIINNTLQLTEICDSKIAKYYTKNYLKQIEIEIFSFCNRKCWYCPNSFIDRHSENKYMQEELYKKILADLKEIEYKGIISYSRYNEPLADKILLERLKMAREACPGAILRTNTNGDYLNRTYLDLLAEAGMNEIAVQCYVEKGTEFSIKTYQERLDKLLTKLEIDGYIMTEYDTENRFCTKLEYSRMDVYFDYFNFETFATNRGESLDSVVGKERQTSCMIPFKNLYIDYNGSYMICCNMRSDIESHIPYIIGDANKDSISDVFMGKKMIEFRKKVGKEKIVLPACKTCSFQTWDSEI